GLLPAPPCAHITRSVMTTIPNRENTMLAPEYLRMMLIGYLITIAVETAVLVLLLSRRHSMRVRVFAGVWLTACTYPVVWLVLPPLLADRELYLLVAEVFAPVVECLLFWAAFVRRLPPDRRATAADMVAITIANLCPLGVGGLVHA